MVVVVDDPRDHGLGLRIVLQVVLVTSYEYDDAGRQDAVVAPAGIVTDTEYDDRAAAAPEAIALSGFEEERREIEAALAGEESRPREDLLTMYGRSSERRVGHREFLRHL